MSTGNPNENPFIGPMPADTLNNCRYVLDILIDSEPAAGEVISERSLLGRQLIYVGIGDAIQHAINTIAGDSQ